MKIIIVISCSEYCYRLCVFRKHAAIILVLLVYVSDMSICLVSSCNPTVVQGSETIN